MEKSNDFRGCEQLVELLLAAREHIAAGRAARNFISRGRFLTAALTEVTGALFLLGVLEDNDDE